MDKPQQQIRRAWFAGIASGWALSWTATWLLTATPLYGSGWTPFLAWGLAGVLGGLVAAFATANPFRHVSSARRRWITRTLLGWAAGWVLAVFSTLLGIGILLAATFSGGSVADLFVILLFSVVGSIGAAVGGIVLGLSQSSAIGRTVKEMDLSSPIKRSLPWPLANGVAWAVAWFIALVTAGDDLTLRTWAVGPIEREFGWILLPGLVGTIVVASLTTLFMPPRLMQIAFERAKDESASEMPEKL